MYGFNIAQLVLADIFDLIPVVIFIIITLIATLAQGLGNANKKKGQANRPNRPGQEPPRRPLRDEIEVFLEQARKGERAGANKRREPEVVEAEVIEDSARGHSQEQWYERETPALPYIEDDFSHVDDQHLDHLGVGRIETVDLEEIDEVDRNIVAPPGPATRSWAITGEDNPVAAGLFEMLSTPLGVQQAIVLTELLNRPEHRWT